MPAGSTKKLKITSDDIAESAPRSDHDQSVLDQPRIVIRDVVPSQRLSRWRLVLVPFVLVVLFGLLTLARWTKSPQTSWTEQIASTADRSIVQIRTADGLGTGFVIASGDHRHLILTNRHVLASAGSGGLITGQVLSQCHVLLRNGQSVIGRLVGLPRDPELDLALLVISVSGLQPLGEIAPFSDIRVGLRVVAVGHPHGLDFTVTDGIVSAKREGLLIQTSAAINPGNSGGPLIDEHLRVIGVNTLTVRPDVAHGLGFAIRADIALDMSAWELSETVFDLMRSTRRSMEIAR